MVLKPELSTSPGNLLKMQILRIQLRPTKSETVKIEPNNLCFNEPSR